MRESRVRVKPLATRVSCPPCADQKDRGSGNGRFTCLSVAHALLITATS